ncbi:MAG: c(7)-type cytochrome triheme domain-containing protein, partial [Nanoarchaeota archaeon]
GCLPKPGTKTVGAQSAKPAETPAATATPAATPAATPTAAPTATPAATPPPATAEKKEVSPILDPTDRTSVIYLGTTGVLAGTGDPVKSGPPSEAARVGAAWHPTAMATVLLPKDKYGLVDWAKAAKQDLIKPKAGFTPEEEEDEIIMDLDVVIEAKSDFVNDVVYPHYIHTWWLSCSVCHPAIFIPSKGANNMTMVEISRGKFCGRCHGKVSFPLTDCFRCHVKPKQAKKTDTPAATPTAAPAQK